MTDQVDKLIADETPESVHSELIKYRAAMDLRARVLNAMAIKKSEPGFRVASSHLDKALTELDRALGELGRLT